MKGSDGERENWGKCISIFDYFGGKARDGRTQEFIYVSISFIAFDHNCTIFFGNFWDFISP